MPKCLLRSSIITTCLFSLLAGCASQTAQVETERLSDTVRVLASDEFEGRAPGGPGEAKTVSYLIDQFAAMGLEPGGDDGGWTQAVPLIKTRVQPPARLEFTAGGRSLPLAQSADMAVDTVQPRPEIVIAGAPVAFVGFGVTAPERDWDDFGDFDLSGKVALFLVNDPDFAAAPGEPVAGAGRCGILGGALQGSTHPREHLSQFRPSRDCRQAGLHRTSRAVWR
jgi:hypothetical protein